MARDTGLLLSANFSAQWSDMALGLYTPFCEYYWFANRAEPDDEMRKKLFPDAERVHTLDVLLWLVQTHKQRDSRAVG